MKRIFLGELKFFSRICAALTMVTGFSACSYRSDPFYKAQDSSQEKMEIEKDWRSLPVARDFAEIDRELIQPYCIRCHNSAERKGGVDLSSLSKIAADPGLLQFGNSGNSLFYLTVLEGSMPPRGELPSLELAEKLRQWIDRN